jgi:Protein of unknown function (DUF2510)
VLAAGSASALLKEWAMDTRDDKPEGSAPVDGKVQPPGWYPDPAGGWALRWWDGTRWTEHLTVTPRKPKWTWNLASVFQIELGLALFGLFVSFLSVFASDACGTSDRCYRLVYQVWLLWPVVQAVLVAVCWLAFSRSKWIGVKWAAAVGLPVGIVASWVVANQLLTKAQSM